MLQRVVAPGEEGFEALEAPGKPQALVVVPTRELAVQVSGDLQVAGKLRGVRVLTVYGGRAYEPQIEALVKGVEVVVGTPGRLLDLAQQKHLTLGHARMVVLDEADEMLDLGFLPDVEKLLAQTPAGRQTMLFSATMPGPVVSLARSYMTQPTHIRAADPDDTGATVKATKQVVYRAHALDKVEMLARILQARDRGLTIIFARTKRTVAKVADELGERGFAVGALHGDLGQGAREQALRAFRKGKVDVLVATDVAARGIDVDDVTHVINYQCPEDEKTYLHRIGRTARAGNTGTAVTFVDWEDLARWSLIDKGLDLGIPEPAETYSSSPALFEDLDIPEGTRGTLPRDARTRAGLDAEDVEDLGETGRRQPGARALAGVAGRTPRAAAGRGAAAAVRPRRRWRRSPPRTRRRGRAARHVRASADAPVPASPWRGRSRARPTPPSSSCPATGRMLRPPTPTGVPVVAGAAAAPVRAPVRTAAGRRRRRRRRRRVVLRRSVPRGEPQTCGSAEGGDERAGGDEHQLRPRRPPREQSGERRAGRGERGLEPAPRVNTWPRTADGANRSRVTSRRR